MKEKNGIVWPLGRLKRSGATLGLAAALLLFSVIAGSGSVSNNAAVPAAAEPGAVYALSYRNLDTDEGLALFESDIETFKRYGLSFILPDELRFGSGGVILIAEDGDAEQLAALLKARKAKAVIVMRESMTQREEKAALGGADEGVFAIAAPFEQGCGPLDIFKNIASAGGSAAVHLGRTVRIFMAEVPEESAYGCFAGMSESPQTFVFLFGNGLNEPPFPKGGIIILNRVMRLPEWTTEVFLRQIAVSDKRDEK